MKLPEYVTVNGTRYTTAKLPDEAKSQVVNIQVVDAELARLHQQLAIAQTARNAYSAALQAAMKHKEEGPIAEKPKKPRAPRKPKAE